MLDPKAKVLQSKVVQSPMAGCTDLAFRLLAREYGMKFAFLEMVSAEALMRDNVGTANLMKTVEADKPLGAQLVGCNPETMGQAAARVEEMGYDSLDLNLGCPVPKIVSPGGGSALLKEPGRCKEIFQSVVKNIKSIPVTVKMRKGFSDESGAESVEIAKIAEDAGISAVTVHGRTRAQGYSGVADWEAIARVKRAVKIPVFGNGDVTSGEDARRLLDISGCDGVMVGRGALGNPWIYRSIEAVLRGDKIPAPATFKERKEAALKHFELEMKIEGPRLGVLKCRRIICWYFKTYPGVAEFRNAINHATSPDEMRDLIEKYELPNDGGQPYEV